MESDSHLPFCFEQKESKEILENLCSKYKIDSKLIEDICLIEMSFEGSGRPYGVYEEIQRALQEFQNRQKPSKPS
jgi:hypothetical protein